jgi:hypothetical protein
MDTTIQNINVIIPSSDMSFFKDFARRMGWKIGNEGNIIDKYLSSRPQNVDLTDDEIIDEINAVRYK